MCTEFLTHACENITFPKITLQTVKTNGVNTKFWITKLEKIIEVKKCWYCRWKEVFEFNQIKLKFKMNKIKIISDLYDFINIL